MNFDFRRTSKKCSVTDRTLQPGESCFSALIERGDETVRLDFSEQAWTGPPEDCIGWWKTSIPESDKGKVYWVPRSVQLSYFEHLMQQESQRDAAYITGLLLLQKKVLALDDSIDDASEDSALLHLKNRKTNQTYVLTVVEVAPDRLHEIQQELSERLFSDQPCEVDEHEQSEETFES